MKPHYLIILAASALILFSCGGNKNIGRSDDDKSIATLVRKLNKDPNNPQLQNDLKYLYAQAIKEHEGKAMAYRASGSADRWNNVINEYNAMQLLYNTVSASINASRVVQPKSYFTEIQNVSQEAAGFYYEEGKNYLAQDGRENSRLAYMSFQKSNQYVPGFKDASRQMQVAYNLGIANVVINPIRDNEILFTSWNNTYNREYIQERLAKDLASQGNATIPARFYTDKEARQQDITADYLVDINWNQIMIPSLNTSQSGRTVSQQIEAGKDSLGKIKYQTVYANLSITRKYFVATGNLDYRISNPTGKDQGTSNTLVAKYNWQHEQATYTGDSRALSSADWALVNNTNNSLPKKDEVMNELMKNVYGDLKTRIRNAVDW